MDIITQRLSSARGGVVNANLGNFLDGFRLDNWPPHEEVVSRSPRVTMVTAFPVSTAPRAIPSQVIGGYTRDFYNQVHISPIQLDLGNVVSTQTSAVRVWNAYLNPMTLQDIRDLPEGVQLSGQGTVPLLFKPLQERSWQMAVTPDGQPTLDDKLVWHFSGGVDAALRITANRIIAWSFIPDWGESVIERLSTSTGLLASESGVEQRRNMRLAPRREFEARLFVEGRERQLLDLSLYGWGSRIWALPIWPDVQQLKTGIASGALRVSCDTRSLDFRVGGLAMLRGETAFDQEVVEIRSLDGSGLDLARPLQRSWSQGTRLYPVRTARLSEQPSLVRLNDRVQSASVKFLLMEPSDWNAALPGTLYRGWPVLEMRPDESAELTQGFQHLLSVLDNGMALPLYTDTAGRALPVLNHRWMGLGREERAAFRALVYGLRGQQKAIWVPTHADDLTLMAEVSDVSSTIDVANVGYSRFAQARPGRSDIRIELVDGSVWYRRITSASELDGETERLALDAVFGRRILPSQVARISWLALCRGNSDSVELEHVNDSEGLARSALTFRGVRDDEF